MQSTDVRAVQRDIEGRFNIRMQNLRVITFCSESSIKIQNYP